MSKWILTIHPLNSSFTYIGGHESFQLDIRFNTDLQRGESAVFRTSSLEVGDQILGMVTSPTNEIRYIFEVLEVNSPTITLRKSLESFYGISLDELREMDSTLYIELMQTNLEVVGKIHLIEEGLFQLIETRLVEPFVHEDNREDENEHIMRDPDLNYESPNKDPKENKLPHNRIVYGSPGTGKSYQLEKERKDYFAKNFERVTFHQNYSYGQFVGTYKPKPTTGESRSPITYKLVPGPFLRLLGKALKFANRNYVLIIEEINRANTAAVFGDVFQLLDRDDNGKSEYSIMVSEEIKEYLEEEAGISLVNSELYLPDNFYIWSTMNTADQGVHPMDSAFKRRFEFEYIGINDNEQEIENITISIPGIGDVDWNEFRIKLNDFLLDNVRNIKEDKLIGPFFIKKSILNGDNQEFKRTFKNKLLMYLAEDVLKMNKNILFEPTSFSKIVEEYDRNRNIFSENFRRFIQPNLS